MEIAQQILVWCPRLLPKNKASPPSVGAPQDKPSQAAAPFKDPSSRHSLEGLIDKQSLPRGPYLSSRTRTRRARSCFEYSRRYSHPRWNMRHVLLNGDAGAETGGDRWLWTHYESLSGAPGPCEHHVAGARTFNVNALNVQLVLS